MIKIIRSKPQIWDTNHPHHVSNASSDDEGNLDQYAQFAPIAEQIGINADECLRQFDNLKQQYFDAAARGDLYSCPHFEELSFLSKVKLEQKQPDADEEEQFIVEPSLEIEHQSFAHMLEESYSYSELDLTEEDYTMDQTFNWGPEEDEKLIEFVKNCPALWQTDHKDFVASPGIVSVEKSRDRFTKRFRFLVPIARALGTTAAECEHHFSILRVSSAIF